MAEDLWDVGAKSVNATENPGSKADLWDIAAKESGNSPEAKDFQGRRTEFQRLMKTDPSFRAKPAEERRKVLFPDETESAPAVQPKPGRGFMGSMQDEAGKGADTAASGWQELIHPQSYARTLTGLPLLNIAAGTVQQVLGPPAGLFNEYVSRPLGNLARKLPVPDPETLGQQTEIASDVAVPQLIGKGLSMAKAPLARLLPTKAERLSDLEGSKAAQLSANESQLTGTTARLAAEREKRLADLQNLTTQAQTATVKGQAERLKSLPAERAAIQEKTAADIAAEQQSLAVAQSKVGQQAAESSGPVGPKSRNFDKRYEALRSKGDQVTFQPVNLNTAAGKISQESGQLGAPVAFPERSAAAIMGNLTEGEDVGQYVRRALREGGDTKAANYGDIIKSVLAPATADNVTGRQLIDTIKRLRKSETAAYGSGHKDLGRQFGVLEQAAVEDLKGNRGLSALHKRIDKDYSKQMATEWWADGVQNSFNDKTGAWDRGKFTKWFMEQTDTKDSDKFLKRLLGDRYDGAKGTVEAMQEASSLNIEKASAEATRNLKRRMGTDLRAVNSRQSDLDSLAKQTEEKGIFKASGKAQTGVNDDIAAQQKAAEKAASDGAKRIEADIRKKMEAITGKPYTGKFHELYAMGSIILGAGTAAGGAITGNAGLMYSGVATAGGGAFTLMTHDAMLKMFNSARGASLMQRAIRAAPGTGEAISASAAISNYAKQLESKPQDQAQPAKPADAPTPKAPADVDGKKAKLLLKYMVK